MGRKHRAGGGGRPCGLKGHCPLGMQPRPGTRGAGERVLVSQGAAAFGRHEGISMRLPCLRMNGSVATAAFLAWSAVATLGATGSAAARDFRAADTQAEDYPTVQALDGDGPAGQRTDRRAPPHPRVPFAPARRGKGDDRADPGRRHRSQPHQCGAARQLRPGSQRAGAAVPVPLDRASLQGARRAGRRRHPGELRAARLRRARRSTIPARARSTTACGRSGRSPT